MSYFLMANYAACAKILWLAREVYHSQLFLHSRFSQVIFCLPVEIAPKTVIMPNKSLYTEILKFTFFMAILGCVFLRKSKIELWCTLSCVNQVDDLEKNCTLKRDGDVSNFATNSHIELDDNSEVHPKTLTDLPNRFFSSVH